MCRWRERHMGNQFAEEIEIMSRDSCLMARGVARALGVSWRRWVLVSSGGNSQQTAFIQGGPASQLSGRGPWHTLETGPSAVTWTRFYINIHILFLLHTCTHGFLHCSPTGWHLRSLPIFQNEFWQEKAPAPSAASDICALFWASCAKAEGWKWGMRSAEALCPLSRCFII